ncbi:hypothetical protein VNO78_38672 [Psophocarpus tetragonolobus]|uniref:Uncharacterized protein n=1 Tax=Psophocarpus tetragonolobus TaxID=3891 RepID=A0AAN9N8R3_PSOTE
MPARARVRARAMPARARVRAQRACLPGRGCARQAASCAACQGAVVCKGFYPLARWELRFKASHRANPPCEGRQRHVPLGGRGPLLLVGKRTTGARVASSPDSDLEAFSHNPTHGSFAPLAFQPSAMTNCANQRADIEGSKSNVAMNAWLPQASYPCGHLRYLLTDVPPQPNSPPDNVFRPDQPTEAGLGSRKRGSAPLPIHGIIGFPLSVPVLSRLFDARGRDPEGPVPNPSPDRHATTRSRRGSSSSSPPTADGFGTGTPVPSPQSQSFSRGYGSILPTSLAYIVPSTRGCSPWRPDAVMSTTGRGRHSVLQIFKGRRGRTGHHATCGALPAAGPYLRLSRFQGGQAICTDGRSARARALGFAATAAPSYSSGPGPCPDGRVSAQLGTVTQLPVHPASPVLLTKNGPLGALDSMARLNRAAAPSYLFKVCSHSNPSQKVGVGRRCTHRGIPPISFLAPYGFTHPLTRTHVRLLGPCFKTGRMGSPQADARSMHVPRHARGRMLPSTIATMTSPRAYQQPGLGPPSQSASVRAPSRSADRLSPFHIRPGHIADPHPLPSRQFQALFDSLFKVLFIFPSRYLFAIGLSPVFSLGRNLPPDWGCIPKQPDSPTAPRGATGSGHNGALTLSGAPFQGTWARSATEDASPDYNSNARGDRFSWQACPQPNGFGRNLRSKTRWFTGFCNSHQVSHFATFFIDARAEISVAESHFASCVVTTPAGHRLRVPKNRPLQFQFPWHTKRRGSVDFSQRRGQRTAHVAAIRTLHRTIQSVGATGGVYKGQGRSQRELMTRAY